MTAYDVGVLILRVVLGLTMAAHGYNKFFGPGGLKGTAGWFDSMGMKPGSFHARIAATTEMAAGIGLAVGLLTPIPAAGFVALLPGIESWYAMGFKSKTGAAQGIAKVEQVAEHVNMLLEHVP